jgi:glycosyltransferase involved in cell wall biosynthesis
MVVHMGKVENTNTVAFLLKRFDCHDGVASHCETLIRGLIDHGWQVLLITGPVSYDSASVDRFQRLQLMVADWLILDDLNAVLPSLSCLSKINQVIQKFRPSLLHAHGYSMLLIARILYFSKRLKCVATFHPSIHGDDPKTLAAKALNPQIGRYQLYLSICSPSRLIAYSSENAAFLEKDLGVSTKIIRKILLGIDTGYFRVPDRHERDAARKKFGFRENDVVCALVGRLNWNKGHDVLIDAVKQVRRDANINHLFCLFSGTGSQEQRIREYASADHDDAHCFIFSGYVKDLREVYWASDIFVLPSRSEGFALVVAEAMCCGLPPIRTPSGGAVDQIEHGKNGFIIPFDDFSSLAIHLQSLLNDTQLLESLSVNALKVACQKFALEKMVKETILVYEEIV